MKANVIKRGKYQNKYAFEVKFPGEAEFLIPVKMDVEKDTTIATGTSHRVKETIDLSEFFDGLNRKQIEEGLLFYDGEYIKKGDPIFSQKKLGFEMTKILSTAEGLVSLKEIDRGKVQILYPKENIELKSGLDGFVSSVYPEGSVEIEAEAYLLEMFRVFGNKTGGIVKVLKRDDFVKNTSGKLRCKKELMNRLAIINFPLNRSIYKALVIAGAVGIVTPSASSSFFGTIKDLKSITVAIQEGWGNIEIPSLLEEFLFSLDDTYVEIISDGSDSYYGRLVASVIPTKLINDVQKEGYIPLYKKELSIGQKVQIFEPPYWAKEGEIKEIIDEENVISVKLRTGESVVLPGDSVGIIEF
ncbi:hypothetical protein LRY64_00145 [Candidatus Woesebacteria bacterium]|nr:hypothetical protein [Candidatus Woesebacteria bacterium]